MEIKEIFKIIGLALLSFAGAGSIIIALSSWLGKIWAERILGREKAELQKDIEKYKNDLDELKISILRYSGKQFELYHDLWKALCDLEYYADLLWNDSSAENLNIFSTKLNNTREKVLKSYLFIEDSHFKELTTLLYRFLSYQLGKEALLSGTNTLTANDISSFVTHNKKVRDDYKNIKIEIGKSLKKKIKRIE